MKDSVIKINEASRLIMQKPKEQRLPLDNSILSKNFASFPFVIALLNCNEYGQIMYNTLINSLEFKTYQQGTTIFQWKEPYSSMIIVIEGSIVVCKPPTELKKEEAKGRKILTVHNKYKLEKSLIKEAEREQSRILNQGEAYGDKELRVLKKHPCDVEAKSQCIIGILTLTDYFLIFEKTSLLEKISIHRFLLSISFFSNISYSMVENLQETMVKEAYNLGDCVIKQGNPVKKVYVVRKGLFQVSLKSTRRFFNEFDMNYFDKLVKEPQRFTSNRRFELQDSYKTLIEYKLINLGPGGIFCDFEYRNKSEKSYFTVQCTINNSELMSIDMNQFTLFLLPKNKITFHQLVEEKLLFLKKRIKAIRMNQKKLHLQKNKYAEAILSKIPKSINDSNNPKKCLLKSISHEKKCFKVILSNRDKKSNYNSLSNRTKLNSEVLGEFDDKNMQNEIGVELITNSTYITKKKNQSAIGTGSKKAEIRKSFLEHKPYHFRYEVPQMPSIADNILLSNLSEDNNIKSERKNNKNLLWSSYSKQNTKEFLMKSINKGNKKISNVSNIFKMPKKFILNNKSWTISSNMNSVIPCLNSNDSAGF